VRPLTPRLGVEWFDWLVSGLPLIVVSYFAILGVGYAVASASEAEHLRTELAVAQLDALRAQLHPHFLFNTLNAITALVRDQDTRGALDTLRLLSDLLRSVLTADASNEVTLRDELAFIQQYLGIMEVRFSDRLRVVWDVPDQLRDARVPTLVLQPLVENAIRHGIARSSLAGRVEITARRSGDRLILSVRDDGPGPVPETGRPTGVGLANTRARLERLYGDATVTLEPAQRGTRGTVATITMPYHPTPGAAG
jgi:LytS/YehU family sensor histidine kinase